MDAATVSVTRFYTDIEEYARKAQVTSTQELSETTEIYEFEGFDKAYQTMLQNFADAVLTGAALIAPGEDGSKTLSGECGVSVSMAGSESRAAGGHG